MQSVNIRDLVKNIASKETNVKANTKQDSSKGFSKVLKDNSEKQTTLNKNNNDVKEAVVEKSEDNKTDNESINNDGLEKLVEFLVNSEGLHQDKIDMDALKDMLAEILNDSNLIQQIETSNLVNLQMVDFKSLNLSAAVNSDPKQNQILDNLATQAAEKLVVSPGLKEELIAMIQSKLNQPLSQDDKELKQAIIDKLVSMTNGTDEVKIKEMEQNGNQNLENLFSEEKQKSTEPKIQFETKVLSKEDKLLKNLTEDNSQQNNKDSVEGKISNFMTRFEAIRADKPAAVETQAVINKDNFNADFIKTVKFMDANNTKELSVKIIPKDLGEITIRLSMDNGVMKANITTSNKDTYNLLNAQLPAISNQLSEQNMNIQSFNLSLYNGDNFLFNGDGSSEGDNRKQNKGNGRILAVDEEETIIDSYSEDNSSVNILA